MDFAKNQKLIAANPTDGCALPKLEHQEMKTLPVEQLTSFLREAKETGVFEMYYIELATGLRRGELLGLKWEDINLDQGSLRIQRQVCRIDGEVVEAPLKTKNAYRILPLSADAIEVLREQRKKSGSSAYVFPSPTGGPIFTGQRPAYAPPGAETGRVAEGSVPRSPTYLRNPGTAKRRRHQDSLRNAGPLQRRIHPGHLHPRHYLSKERGGKYDGEYPLRRSPVVSGHFAVWVSAWVETLPQIFARIISTQKQRKSPEISRFQDFCGCGDRT